MIVRDIATVKAAIGVNENFNYADISPYLKRAERKFLFPLIGKAQYDIFNAASQPLTGIIGEALFLAQDAVSNLAYYLALPVLSVQISSAGIFVSANENTTPANDKQYKELQRSFKSAGHEALDQLLDFMENNKTAFAEWTSDASYTEFKELLVYNTTTFQKEYNINNSRQTFLALVPNIKTIEDQFISGPVQPALLLALKDTQTEALRKKVKAYLIKSIVAYTVARTMDNGLFALDPNGMHLRFDVLPYEQIATNMAVKINDFLVNTKANKMNEGEEYLKMALEIIANTENATVFSEYVPVTTTINKIDLVKTLGIVGF